MLESQVFSAAVAGDDLVPVAAFVDVDAAVRAKLTALDSEASEKAILDRVAEELWMRLGVDDLFSGVAGATDSVRAYRNDEVPVAEDGVRDGRIRRIGLTGDFSEAMRLRCVSVDLICHLEGPNDGGVDGEDPSVPGDDATKSPSGAIAGFATLVFCDC